MSRSPTRHVNVILTTLLLLGGVIFGAIQNADAAVYSKNLNVPAIKQDNTQWCWAATIQAVARYIRVGTSRDKQAL